MKLSRESSRRINLNNIGDNLSTFRELRQAINFSIKISFEMEFLGIVTLFKNFVARKKKDMGQNMKVIYLISAFTYKI